MLISLQGNLKSFKLPDILTFLNMSRKSGTLDLSDESRETFVYFENGAIIYAASNQEKFRLGSILIYRNRISSAQWQALERVMIQQGEKFGRVAVQENVISEEELR